MPGYHLMEKGTWAPRGLPDRPSECLGFLDFLRELAEDDAAIPRYAEIMVTGLEEVLFAAEGEAEALALDIRRRLRAAASLLQNRLVDVSVVFQGRIQRGEDLWVEYRGRRLPVGHIFGSPHPQTESGGDRIYFIGFNLTNGN
jgi:hypothetical protein